MAYRSRQPAVVLTAFQKQGSLDAYLHEVRSIRESRMFQPKDEDTEDGEPVLSPSLLTWGQPIVWSVGGHHPVP